MRGNRSSTHCRASGSGNSEAERIPKNLDASKLRGLVTLAKKEDEAEGIGEDEAFKIVEFCMFQSEIFFRIGTWGPLIT